MATYYVKPTGNDAKNGRTIANAWRTISKVNSTTFAGGDIILFQCGGTYSGSLSFTAADAGSNATPITVSSYIAPGGSSVKPIISSGTADGLLAYNTGGFVIEDIDFLGAGTFSTDKSGIIFYADLAGNVKLPKVYIDNVEASGYGFGGITIGAFNGTTGFRDVRVTNCDLHGNRKNGFSTYAQSPDAHEDVYVGYTLAYENPGYVGGSQPVGNGIVLGQVDGGVIEHCVAYSNGTNAAPVSGGGPLGIWAYNSNDVTIQYCESYGNDSDASSDGGGFDLDVGCTNSVIQYCYSHDNGGPGFMMCQASGGRAMTGNVIRYNISQNDAREFNGALTIFSGSGNGLANSSFHNNTVYITPTASSAVESAVAIVGTAASSVSLYNNIFITTGNVRSVYVEDATGITLSKNIYWASNGTYDFRWVGVSYTTLAAWQAAVPAQEVGGMAANPLLANAGSGGNLNDTTLLSTLTGYKPTASSPGINAGTSNSVLFDFFRVNLPQGGAYDIGAAEYVEASSTIARKSGLYRHRRAA